MRALRRWSVIIIIIAVIVFAAYHIREEMIADHKAPVITMDSSSITVPAEATEQQLLEGITAVDDRDGDVTDRIIIESLSNFISDDTRRMTVAAFDSAGHVTKASRDIVYSDYKSPVFNLTAPLQFPVGTEDITDPITVTDQLDGDISDQVKVSSDYLLSNSVGDYPMAFLVTNSAGDTVRLEATVTLYDSQQGYCPQIALTDYLVHVPVGTQFDAKDYLQSITINSHVYELSGSSMLVCRDGGVENSTIYTSDVTVENVPDCTSPGVSEVIYRYISDGFEGSVRLIVSVEE